MQCLIAILMPSPRLRSWLGRMIGLACLLAAGGCEGSDLEAPSPGRQELRPGLELERVRPEGAPDAPLLTLVRVDPTRFELRLLTAQEHGTARTAEAWARDFGLLGAINASMYMPNLRSTGLMRRGEVINNGAVNPRFEGFLAFRPRRPDLPPVRMEGSDCGSVDSLIANYEVVIQNYRLLGCEGEPIEWKDPKTYSSAAIGLDHRGWVVFAHTGAPCRTSDFSRWLADESRGIEAAIFVEGGPDASLYLSAGETTVDLAGSYQGGVGTGSRRPIPNVVGFAARSPLGLR